MRINWKPEYKNIQKMYVDKMMSCGDIAKIYKVDRCRIKNVISRTIGLRSAKDASKLRVKQGKVRHAILEPERKNIENFYLNGKSTEDIARIYKTHKNVIRRIISKTIGFRTPSERNSLAAKRGNTHYRWITDRSKLKQARRNAEELWFFKEVLEDRNYTCELTGERGGSLSVHHIFPVWKRKDLQYEKSNVIVILTLIHKQFHNTYGTKGDEDDWKTFIEEQQYAI